MSRKEVGIAGVDSGTLIVIDPCYLKYWGTGEHPELSYDSVMKGLTQLHFKNGVEAAVIIQGFGGDGGYPVFVTEGPSPNHDHDIVVGFDVEFRSPEEKTAARILARYMEATSEEDVEYVLVTEDGRYFDFNRGRLTEDKGAAKRYPKKPSPRTIKTIGDSYEVKLKAVPFKG